MKANMKAIQISRTGGPDVLEYVDLPTPKPARGEVLVRAHAIGVHYFDMLIRSGPLSLDAEAAVRTRQRHERACGGRRRQTQSRAARVHRRLGHRLSRRALCRIRRGAGKKIWPLPENIDLDDAAALSNYALAWTLLHHVARGIEPKNVLVYGAAGGMGTALIDIARLAGANVIALAGSDEKCAFVRQRKAAHVINHSSENVVERVNAATGGRGADIIFNHVAGKTFADDLKMIAPLGLIVNYAVLGGMPQTDLFKDMRANIDRSPALRCFTMHTSEALPELRSEGMKHAIEFLAAKENLPRHRRTPAAPRRRPRARDAGVPKRWGRSCSSRDADLFQGPHTQTCHPRA